MTLPSSNSQNIDYPHDDAERSLLLSLLDTYSGHPYSERSPGEENREAVVHRDTVKRLDYLVRRKPFPEATCSLEMIQHCRPFGTRIAPSTSDVPSDLAFECKHWLCPSCHLRKIKNLIEDIGISGISNSHCYSSFVCLPEEIFVSRVHKFRAALDVACKSAGVLSNLHWGSKIHKVKKDWRLTFFAFCQEYLDSGIPLAGTHTVLTTSANPKKRLPGIDLFKRMYQFDAFTLKQLRVNECPLYFTTHYATFEWSRP